jgi:hypothetical protein
MRKSKVWGIVMVVIGMAFIIGGMSRYSNAVFLGKDMITMNIAIAGEIKNTAVKDSVNPDYNRLVGLGKLSSLALALLGLSFSIMGTFLIKKEMLTLTVSKKADDYIDHLNGPRFKP